MQRSVRQVRHLPTVVTYSRQFRMILFISLLISIRRASREVRSQGAHFHLEFVTQGLPLLLILSLWLPVPVFVRSALRILSLILMTPLACVQVLALGLLLAVFRKVLAHVEILPRSGAHRHLLVARLLRLLPLPQQTGRALPLIRRHPPPAPRPRRAPLYPCLSPHRADLAHSIHRASMAWLPRHHLHTLSIH